MLVDLAAIVYLILTVVAVGFQLALALGAPWGELALGGQYPGRLPPLMRAMAVVQAVVLSLLAVIVLSKAGLILPEATADSPNVAYIPVVVMAFSAWMNINTRSVRERKLWAPVTIAMLVCALVVALVV
jgi:hypothetical protein